MVALKCGGSAHADQTLTGIVDKIFDSDTFAIGESVIRLEGMDAPELAQRCDGGPRQLRNCGEIASDTIGGRIRGRQVACTLTDLDQYDRVIAKCMHTGEELSACMVTPGQAMAFRRYSERLVPKEDAACEAGLGFWQTDFVQPLEVRAAQWGAAKQQAPDGCPIKGNINRDDERIYHTPWCSKWYGRTKLNLAKGELWFCSE